MLNQIAEVDKKIVSGLNSFFARYSTSLLDKIFAEYLIYFLPLILVVLWFFSQQAKKVALRGFFAALVAWPIMANIIGRLIDRARPFENAGVRELIFHRPTYSFTSDHAAAIFAISFSFWLSGYKKLSLTVFIMGVIISFFRVAGGIHYPTDVLGGIVIGLVAAYLIDLFDKPLNLVYNFLIKLLRILRLA